MKLSNMKKFVSLSKKKEEQNNNCAWFEPIKMKHIVFIYYKNKQKKSSAIELFVHSRA